jgi:hypothetical protein
MNIRQLSPLKTPTTSGMPFTPIHGRMLQRKCACGGTPGPSGECDECRKKRMSLQRKGTQPSTLDSQPSEVPPFVHDVLRSPGQPLDLTIRAFMEPRFVHDFSRVPVHPGSAKPILGDSATQIRGSHQLLSEEEETEKYSDDGLLIRNAGSGICVNGGAESVCDPSTGKYSITSNSNTCCTKDCSQEHEQQHVNFENNQGCCKALSVAWNAKGADKAKLSKKYSQWVKDTESIAECQAYSNDVKCADALAKTKDCAGKGKSSDCCKDIDDYRTRYGALAKTHCAKAAKKVPPCPAF